MESKVFLCQKQRWLCRYTMWSECLEKCVDSILAQTEPDFELLLVDDGSTDGSGRLCDKLAEKDGRVRVIHQKNQGLGGARNTGIQQAQGDWLLLVDSDDWIEPQTLEKTMEAGLREEADLVMFAYRSVDEGGHTLRTFFENVPKERGMALDAQPGSAAHLPLGLVPAVPPGAAGAHGHPLPAPGVVRGHAHHAQAVGGSPPGGVPGLCGLQLFKPHGLHHQKPERRP